MEGNKQLKKNYKQIIKQQKFYKEEFFFHHREHEKDIYEKKFTLYPLNLTEWSNNLPINLEIGAKKKKN